MRAKASERFKIELGMGNDKRTEKSPDWAIGDSLIESEENI